MGYAQPRRLRYGGSDWNRTSDTGIFSPLLYQLSYLGPREGIHMLLTRNWQALFHRPLTRSLPEKALRPAAYSWVKRYRRTASGWEVSLSMAETT